MKVVHWTQFNGSGMFRVAESMAQVEAKNGVNSVLADVGTLEKFDDYIDADVHVCHTHVPNEIRTRSGSKYRTVFIGHGTPEHTFKLSVEADANAHPGADDNFMLLQYWLKTADAVVTFWPRHQWIYKSMVDKNTVVDCIPMGIDRTYWKPTESRGKYTGTPAVFTAENCHSIKWPLDLFLAWPDVAARVVGAKLHAAYLPNNLHRWFFPLINSNGTAFHSFVNSLGYVQESVRNGFVSSDYYIGLVRYGDFNRISQEANATGAKTISYAGNPYSDYWITEGDQRIIADELVKIFQGETKPRDKSPVPDVQETFEAMVKIYERIIKG